LSKETNMILQLGCYVLVSHIAISPSWCFLAILGTMHEFEVAFVVSLVDTAADRIQMLRHDN